MKKIVYILFSLFLLGGVSSSCSDNSLDPRLDEIRDNEGDPLKTAEDMRSALTGAYYRMTSEYYYGRDILIFGEVRSDNAYASKDFSNRFVNVSAFELSSTHLYPKDTWEQILKVANSANLVINAEIEDDNQQAVDNYRGQAYALRAIAFFDLLRIYGTQNVENKGLEALGVPYITRFGELDSSKYKRLTVKENRQMIYEDLDKAIELMDDDNTEYTRLNKQSVRGFKSRIALYFATWQSSDLEIAKNEAKIALDMGGDIVSRSAFEGSFAAEGRQTNSVFELAQSGVSNNSTNSIFYIYSYDGYGDVLVLDNVLSLFEQEEDIRGSEKMINYDVDDDLRNIGKYPSMSSNIKIMRYEELVLNYVEAAFRINSGDITALDWLNELVSNRVDGKEYTSLTIEDILLERRKELIFEGFRFDDMMREKMSIPSNPTLTKSVEYGSTKLAFPIPLSEINASKIDQNPGY